MKNWTIPLDNITKQTVTEFGTLTNEQINWKPNSITWSIAQNLDHLIIVNETYYPVLSSLKEGTYKTPFTAKFCCTNIVISSCVGNASTFPNLPKSFPLK